MSQSYQAAMDRVLNDLTHGVSSDAIWWQRTGSTLVQTHCHEGHADFFSHKLGCVRASANVVDIPTATITNISQILQTYAFSFLYTRVATIIYQALIYISEKFIFLRSYEFWKARDWVLECHLGGWVASNVVDKCTSTNWSCWIFWVYKVFACTIRFHEWLFPRKMELWSLICYTVKETVELSVIWDTTTLMRCRWNILETALLLARLVLYVLVIYYFMYIQLPFRIRNLKLTWDIFPTLPWTPKNHERIWYDAKCHTPLVSYSSRKTDQYGMLSLSLFAKSIAYSWAQK